MLGRLYKRCHPITAADIVVASIHKGIHEVNIHAPQVTKDCAVVGLIMAIRDEIDAISDEGLLMGCRRLESNSKVVNGYIRFLQDDIDESEGPDSDVDVAQASTS